MKVCEIRELTEQKRAARELRNMHTRVISAQETERRRLARDLHDGVGQILSGVKYRLESLSGKSGLKEGSGAQIVEISGLIGRAISEIRRVSKNLMPSELQDLGLEPALRTICREFKECAGVEMKLRTGSVPDVMAPELALALFRITQEALNNIGKHSMATRVAVDLSRKGRELVLSVGDNGVGFRSAPLTGRGLGLGSMRERAESVGGSIKFHSASGSGTTLCVRAPLSGEYSG